MRAVGHLDIGARDAGAHEAPRRLLHLQRAARLIAFDGDDATLAARGFGEGLEVRVRVGAEAGEEDGGRRGAVERADDRGGEVARDGEAIDLRGSGSGSGSGSGRGSESGREGGRVDVDGDDFPADTVANVRIPASNPFAGATAGSDEIFHFGLRNSWRITFDRLTGAMYIGDVGQDAMEEIDYEPPGFTGGRNYGWRCMEGTNCTGMTGCTCMCAGRCALVHEDEHQLAVRLDDGRVRVPRVRDPGAAGDVLLCGLLPGPDLVVPVRRGEREDGAGGQRRRSWTRRGRS